jgi:RNA polymerase subunit RPABC4/transcription elongation factor Spt4
MSKAHRGKGIRELFARGRGVCPVCGTSGAKLLYEQESDGNKVKVCKPCKAAIKHGKKSLPAAPAAAE